MRDEIATLRRWQEDGVRFALATVTSTSDPAPRPAGATLAVHPDGRVIGSVSGGCVEGAVVEVAGDVLRSGIPQRLSYGIADEDALAVGLTCGGTIEVFVRPVTPTSLDVSALAAAIEAGSPIAVATILEHPTDPQAVGRSVLVSGQGGLPDDRLDRTVVRAARGMLAQGVTGVRRFGAQGQARPDEVGVLIESFAPRPRMLIFGATDHAAALSSVGRFLGYHVTVCDARSRFATRARFPDADEVVVDWPHRYLEGAEVDERTAICVLTHDPKFDVPVLKVALRSSAVYVGVMGSRRTHDDRRRRLMEAGVPEGALARLRGPIGLDLGGRTQQETAIAIAAELTMVIHGATGVPLTESDGPIHHDRQESTAWSS